MHNQCLDIFLKNFQLIFLKEVEVQCLNFHRVFVHNKLLQLNNPESEYLIEPIIIAKIETNINVLYIILSLLTIN